MIIRNLDGNGDWKFGKGLSSFVSGELAIELNIKTRVLSWKNDCFFALPEGIDYMNLLSKGTQDDLALAIKTMILSSFGVVGITAFEVTLDSKRNLQVSCNIDTIYGKNFQTTISQELI